MKFKGNVWKYGHNVNTDAIIPARYLNISAPEALAKHCMEDIDPDFAGAVKPGDIIVAGDNFGCGSSREHAPLALKGAGVTCVIARSFARIFYRNAINIGLPILPCEATFEHVQAGAILEVDLGEGLLIDMTTGREFQAERYPPFMLKIIQAGGLVPYTKRRLGSRSSHDQVL